MKNTPRPFEQRRVVMESPYAGNVEANIAYGRKCLRDCLQRGESPLASHLLYTQEGVLNDACHVDRAAGINAGHAWMYVAHAVVVYTDRGISEGMRAGIASAEIRGIPVEYRSIPE